jgi:hypothetical protein
VVARRVRHLKYYPLDTLCHMGQSVPNATLTVVSFSSFDDFHKFMDNLQSEVLQLEFNEFSRGYKVGFIIRPTLKG